MKCLATIFLTLSLASAVIAQDATTVLQTKYATEVRQMKDIHKALLDYQLEFMELPDSLVTLVTTDYIRVAGLHIKQEDGAVQIPTYYPGRVLAGTLEEVLITYDIPNTEQRISVDLRGKITIGDKSKKPNKAEMATPRKPSD